MKNTKIEVPAVAWWVLAALLIPVLQVWIEQTFPGSSFVWAPLVVGALGAVLKWINWVMQQNSQPVPSDTEGDELLAPQGMVELTDDEYFLLDYEREGQKFDPVEFLFGVKR